MGARIRLWCPDMVVTVSLFLYPILSVHQEAYQDDRREDHPGARSYETNRDVKWICRTLARMEAQDRAFEHLTEKCAYLIDVRGYAAWTI